MIFHLPPFAVTNLEFSLSGLIEQTRKLFNVRLLCIAKHLLCLQTICCRLQSI